MKNIIISLIALVSVTSAFAQRPEPSKVTVENPLRVAVAGVTHDHLSGVTNRVRRGDIVIVGVAEKDDNYREQTALHRVVSEDKFYKDLGQMLDETKPEVVVAYGPIYDHLEVVEACAPRHISVMVEKPLATTVKQAKRIAELARKYDIQVLTNYETSWYATNYRIKEAVEAGAIGKIQRMEVYDGHQGPIEIGCSKRFTDWLTDPVLNGGGAIIDFGCYGANLTTWLMNGERPVSVYGLTSTNKPDVYPKVDDDSTIILKYENGATVAIMGSWCWPYSRKDMYVYGSKGYIYQKNANQMEGIISGETKPAFKAEPIPEPYNNNFNYLRAVVRGEIEVLPSDLAALENNLTVVEILEAGKKSAKSGKPVKF